MAIDINSDKLLFLAVDQFGMKKSTQKMGIDYLVRKIADDPTITDYRHMAYMLATCWHETAQTMQPVEEFGQGQGKRYGIRDALTGYTYFGRGYVQLTWADNYKSMGHAIGVDLYRNPDLARDPDTAYQIMSVGMGRGLFTGVRMVRYIHDDTCDYINARRVINGTDCAEKIAGYARDFESIIDACKGGNE